MENKNAEWIDVQWTDDICVDYDTDKPVYADIWSGQCSECRKFSSWFGPHYGNQNPYKYCPNCGTRIDSKI